MATLPVTVPTQMGYLEGRRFFLDTVNANNATSNQISWTTPPLASRYILLSVSVWTVNAQTSHDIHADGEVMTVRLRDSNDNNNIGGYWHARIFNAGEHEADSWFASVDINTIVHAGHIIQLSVPPCDDGGAPTGDYRVAITLLEIGSWQ